LVQKERKKETGYVSDKRRLIKERKNDKKKRKRETIGKTKFCMN